MELDLKKYEAVFKYKDSLYFQKALLNHYLKNKIIIPEESLEKKNQTFLKKIIELTGLDINEFKKVIGTANFYNIQPILYAVNTALINLLKKDKISKNYIKNVIKKAVKDKLFTKLNKKKLERILSLFSEILCINTLMAGRKSFIVSGDKFSFEYRKAGYFDLIFKNEKTKLICLLDVKRITLDNPISDVNEKKIKQKIAEKIVNVCKKAHSIDRPVFLLLDCSDLSVTEKLVKIDKEKNLPVFDIYCNTRRIYKILKSFFKENKGIMKELEYIAGVGLFYWFLGICENKEKKRFDLGIVFWHQPYTNLHSKFKKENKQLIEINNILYKTLEKEETKILKKLSKHCSFKIIKPQ